MFQLKLIPFQDDPDVRNSLQADDTIIWKFKENYHFPFKKMGEMSLTVFCATAKNKWTEKRYGLSIKGKTEPVTLKISWIIEECFNDDVSVSKVSVSKPSFMKHVPLDEIVTRKNPCLGK